MSVKLVSINIEGSKHLKERVLPFIEQESPDVILLQEVFHDDVEKIKTTVGMNGLFVPMALVKKQDEDSDELDTWGLLLLSKLPVLDAGFEYYHRYHDDGQLPVFFSTQNPEQMDRALGWITVAAGKDEFMFATTHFTWSKEGLTTPLQETAYQNMKKLLDSLPISVLTGDFNAPRGRKIFDALAKRYTDNIPQEISTTIDNKIHKASDEIMLVVDGLFSESGYRVTQVQVSSGVSDHKAVSAVISKVD